MNVTSLKHQILKGNIKNVYLFSGPEISDKKEIINLIEKQLSHSGQIDKFFFNGADNSENTNVFDTLSMGMLFSTAKLVVVSSIENTTVKFNKNLKEYLFPMQIDSKTFSEKLLPSLSNENDTELINKIYKFDSKNDIYVQNQQNKNEHNEKEKKSKKKNKLKISKKKHAISLILDAKIINPSTFLVLMSETNAKISNEILNLFDDTNHIIFWEMFENQKHEWVNNEFRKRNLFIEKGAISFILEMTENIKDKLLFEIQKIVDLFNELNNKEKSDNIDNTIKNVINKEFIENFLYHSREETPFSLFSLILQTNIKNYQENLPRILEILEKLFFTDERQLFNILIWSLRKFIIAIDLYENEKYSYDKIFSSLRITSKRNKEDYIVGFNNYSFKHCTLLFYKLSQLDYYLKILPNELKLIRFQEFIINFVYGDIQKSFLQGQPQYYQL